MALENEIIIDNNTMVIQNSDIVTDEHVSKKRTRSDSQESSNSGSDDEVDEIDNDRDSGYQRLNKLSRRSYLQWTQQEDDTIIRGIELYGDRAWSCIARLLKGRTGKQCRDRWRNSLCPGVKLGGWTEEEDRVLFETQQKIGNYWAVIAEHLPGRTDLQVKNRYYSTRRKINKMINSPTNKKNGLTHVETSPRGPSCQVPSPKLAPVVSPMNKPMWISSSQERPNLFQTSPSFRASPAPMTFHNIPNPFVVPPPQPSSNQNLWSILQTCHQVNDFPKQQRLWIDTTNMYHGKTTPVISPVSIMDHFFPGASR